MVNSLERNKGFTVLLLGIAIVLLILATAGLDSQILMFSTAPIEVNAAQGAAVDRYEELFRHEFFTNFVADPKKRDVFATSYFNKPKPTPKPKPGTREVSVNYMGAIENSRGEITAFLRVDDKLMKLTAGDSLIADWKVALVTGQQLVLTNGEAKTNSVAFNTTLKISVPIR